MKTIPLLEPLADDLELVERRLVEPVHADYPHLTAVLESLLGSGGKRLRPALALLAGRIYAADLSKLVSLAASVEMLHTATLVHDDLIDGALMRRGNTTLNARWSMGATVLTGDYLFARAAALAAETNHVRVMAIFANTLMVICSGELRQIFDRHNLPRLDSQDTWQGALDRYDERINAKTASLFSASTEAAAVLGGAPETEVAALCEYGRLLGMGFQIIDDVLDFEGDQSVLGKPVGSDLREGIVTLPVLYFQRDHPNDSRVAQVVQEGGSDELVFEVVEDIRASGAVSRALDRARDFITRSQDCLSVLPNSEPRVIMHALADYTISR
ncbi:MAG: polyprenyl synthetase family protein, partial [Anaerolineae bacterium]|nr:polyprenyl synthetase family protein [Anaerolineae bacterium]